MGRSAISIAGIGRRTWEVEDGCSARAATGDGFYFFFERMANQDRWIRAE